MTVFFAQLDKRIKGIGKNLQSLLSPDPLTHNDSKSQDIIKSYILLCHAEFEEYFESITKKGISMIDSQIETIAMLNDKQKNALYNFCNSSIESINKNNGIKWDNIRKLLKLVGFDTSLIDDVYITKLNEFGQRRGLVAHNGMMGISTLLSFSEEESNIKWLVDETKDLIDAYFND